MTAGSSPDPDSQFCDGENRTRGLFCLFLKLREVLLDCYDKLCSTLLTVIRPLPGFWPHIQQVSIKFNEKRFALYPSFGEDGPLDGDKGF